MGMLSICALYAKIFCDTSCISLSMATRFAFDSRRRIIESPSTILARSSLNLGNDSSRSNDSHRLIHVLRVRATISSNFTSRSITCDSAVSCSISCFPARNSLRSCDHASTCRKSLLIDSSICSRRRANFAISDS